MTQLAKYLDANRQSAVGKIVDDTLLPLDLPSAGFDSLADLLATDDPQRSIDSLTTLGSPLPLSEVALLPPIDHQEVWAAGVTYKRSQTARMEESEAAADCYDRVYQSPRPELFFKATPSRVCGDGQPLRIRADAAWNVPEPELALVLSPAMQIVGFTVGNDMSSRDIEGDNPLYLPQAKCYDQCCGLGPWITLADDMPEPDKIAISLEIYRGGSLAFQQETGVWEMARTFEDLVSWLKRDNSFPNGAFLLTGTGIVPDSDFTLAVDDRVEIAISGIGTLHNSIVQRANSS